MGERAELEKRLRAHATDYIHAHATERLLTEAADAIASLERRCEGARMAEQEADRERDATADTFEEEMERAKHFVEFVLRQTWPERAQATGFEALHNVIKFHPFAKQYAPPPVKQTGET